MNKNDLIRPIFLFTAVLMVLAMLALPAAGQEATPGASPVATTGTPGGSPTATRGTPTASATFGPTAVQPNRVSNTADTQLVITGAGFADGASAILDGYGALETTFVSESMLRALLPANVTPGVYNVRVVNPDAASAVLEDALTVTAPAATAGPTETPDPTSTPQPTAFLRPVIVVQSYGASSAQITPGQNLDFEITLANAGQSTASNIIATFVSGDFTARATGGVRAVGQLTPGQPSRFWQPLAASPELSGKSTAVLEVQVAYTDLAGTAYSESFSLTFPVVRVASGPGASPTPTPTATAAPRLRPQLLVSSYATDVDPLEPGARFSLSLDVRNAGNTGAERVTLIVGGGSDSGGGGGPVEGTPVPGDSGNGGVSGAGGEFGNFAPVGSSNVSYLGDLQPADTLQAEVQLIVNASTKPGAYPVVVSFVYNDEAGTRYVDEQVVTLLVYARPLVEINFYTEPAPLFAGQPGPLPVQLVNVGKNSSIFGNMNISGSNAQFTNNNIFIGALEPGGFFPLDATVIPEQPGVLELIVRVNYTDDFNQPQVISQTLTIDVLEAPPMEEPPIDPGTGEPGGPAGPGGPIDPGSETWRQKVWRFVLGLIGLSSGRPQPEGVPGPGPIEGPVDGPGGMPAPSEPIPIDPGPGLGAGEGSVPARGVF